MSKQTAKTLVPKLRFPEFQGMGKWIIRGLSEFITERNQSPQEKVPLFSLTIESGVTPKAERYERSFLVKDEKNAYKLVLNDDFAYNPMNLRFGAIAKHSGTKKVALSKYYNIFFCDNSVDPKFCELYFRSHNMIMLYDNIATGSLIEKRRVHFSAFLKLEICFPPLKEQQKIANCLSSIDELITAHSQKHEALKAHKKSLMQQLFPAEGETVPKLRFPEFRDAGEWEEKKLGDLSRILRGGSPRPIDDYITLETSGLNWLKIADVNKEAKYVTCTKERVRVTALSKTREVNPGDLIMSNSMSFGRPYILKIKSCIHDGWIAVTEIDEQTSRNYLYYLILSPESQAYFLNNAAGSGVLNLNADIIKLLPVLIPKDAVEQQKIADCLSSIDDLITTQAKKIESLKIHKKGLMQQLFPATDEVNG